MNVPRLLLRASLRHFLHHRLQTLLAVLGVAVGVAAWVSVHTAAGAARQAFELSTERAFGEASHQLLPLADTLPDAVYVDLRTGPGVQRAAPVLGGRVRVSGPDAPVTVDLLGVDPLSEAQLRPGSAAADDGGLALIALVGDREAAVLPLPLAARLGVGEGDTLTLQRAEGTASLRVAATVDADALPLGEDTVLTDIAAAQAVLGLGGRLSRVDLSPTDAELERLRAWLPDGVELVTTAARASSVAGMAQAYRLNLQALSLLTLLVGVLLVYSTLTRFVVQRRVLFTRLSALGLPIVAQRRLVLIEALALGLAGGALGAAAGSVMARWLVRLVTGNITDLYFRVQVQTLTVDAVAVTVGVALGAAAAVLGAAVALQGLLAPRSGNPPAASGGRLAGGALLALPVALVAALLLLLTDALLPALAALFLVALAFTLLLPLSVRALCGLLDAATPLGRRLHLRMALRATAAGLPRTRVALAGLALAVAAVVAMDTMTGNFRASVADWLYEAVPGDFTVSVDAAVYTDPAAARLPQLGEALAARADVARVSGVRTRPLPGGEAGEQLRAIDARREPPRLVAGVAGAPFRAGNGVLVSEPLARHRGLAPGDTLLLRLPDGEVGLPVLGVVRDYASDRGVALIALERYRELTGDPALTGLAVHADGDAAELAAALREVLDQRPGLLLTAAGSVRERTLEIFDRTFTVTRVLRVLAAAVAFLGIFGTLLALLLDRRRLHRALRAVGMPGRALRSLEVLETAVLGFATALVALPLGLVLSALLVFVINRRAFGWGMQFEPMAAPLVAGAALAVLTAVAAGLAASLAQPVRASTEPHA